MKKIARIACLLGFATLAMVSVSFAAVLNVNDTITIGYSAGHLGGFNGGAFYIADANGAKVVPYTFCLEYNEYLSDQPFTIQSISDTANGGGKGNGAPGDALPDLTPGDDQISAQTSWLYREVILGKYTMTGTVQRDLQLAFWYLENEIASLEVDSGAWVIAQSALAYNKEGFEQVRVINPISATGARKQSMLYYVPEPGTMGLLGFGMTALAFISRRRSSRK